MVVVVEFLIREGNFCTKNQVMQVSLSSEGKAISHSRHFPCPLNPLQNIFFDSSDCTTRSFISENETVNISVEVDNSDPAKTSPKSKAKFKCLNCYTSKMSKSLASNEFGFREGFLKKLYKGKISFAVIRDAQTYKEIIRKTEEEYTQKVLRIVRGFFEQE